MLDIARLIGRQMAREDFERLRVATANDNSPDHVKDGGRDGDRIDRREIVPMPVNATVKPFTPVTLPIIKGRLR